MRFLFVACVLAAVPVVAAAQPRRGGIASAPAPPSISSPSLPSIGLPLPPIGLPLPPIGLPPPTVNRPVFERGHHRPRRPVFFVPFFDWYYPYGYPSGATLPAPPPETRTPEVVTGTLRLDVQPEKILQVFVNGYYVGNPLDFWSELTLEAGTHTIELSAPGYESVKFRVQIDGTRPIAYRGELKPLEQPPPADVPPSTLYYIPGCYLGNVDPKEVKLPDNCDMSRLITRPSR
jgi:hypothetical protein